MHGGASRMVCRLRLPLAALVCASCLLLAAAASPSLSYGYTYKQTAAGTVATSYLQEVSASSASGAACTSAADCLAQCPTEDFIASGNATTATVEQQVGHSYPLYGGTVYCKLSSAIPTDACLRPQYVCDVAASTAHCKRLQANAAPLAKQLLLVQLTNCTNALRTYPAAFADAINAVCSLNAFLNNITTPP